VCSAFKNDRVRRRRRRRRRRRFGIFMFIL
jgi:hypothetical protein